MEDVEQDVGVLRIVEIGLAGTVLQQHVAGHAESRCRRCGLARMVGLGRALRHHGIGTLGLSRRHQILELAGLVAARRKPRAIVALDPDFRTVELPRQIVEPLQRSRQMRQRDARKASQIHGKSHLGFLVDLIAPVPSRVQCKGREVGRLACKSCIQERRSPASGSSSVNLAQLWEKQPVKLDRDDRARGAPARQSRSFAP